MKRLLALWLVSYIWGLMYFLAVVIIAAHQWCEPYEERWFYTSYLGSPYWLFTLGFIALAGWSTGEIVLIIVRKQWSMFKLSALGAIFLLTGMGCFAQFTNWQTIEIAKGESTYRDYWVLLVEEQLFHLPNRSDRAKFRKNVEGEPPDLQEYLYQKSCGAGIQPWNIPHKAYEDYDQMWYDYSETMQNEEIRASLYKMFKIEDDERR